MSLFPDSWLLPSSCMKKKDVTRKGGGSFVDQGVWMLTGSGLKLAFAHRCSCGPDHMQTDSRVHEGNERQQ